MRYVVKTFKNRELLQGNLFGLGVLRDAGFAVVAPAVIEERLRRVLFAYVDGPVVGRLISHPELYPEISRASVKDIETQFNLFYQQLKLVDEVEVAISSWNVVLDLKTRAFVVIDPR